MRVDQADHAFVPPRLIGAGAGVLVFHVHEHRLARMFVEESHETVEQVRKQELVIRPWHVGAWSLNG